MQNAEIVGLSQQTALQRNLDIIAHNLANMDTTAYKVERPLFHTYLAEIRDVEGRHDNARMVNDYGMTRDMSEGALKSTSNPFDVAIQGKGYFMVSTSDGERYTRNGHFGLNGQGQLVTSDGDPVLEFKSLAHHLCLRRNRLQGCAGRLHFHIDGRQRQDRRRRVRK